MAELMLEPSKTAKVIVEIEGIKPITMTVPTKIATAQVKRWHKKGYETTQ